MSSTTSGGSTDLGGTFKFIQPRPAPYTNDAAQQINGGHTQSNSSGCSFPNVSIDNDNDVNLNTKDTKVRT